MATKKKKVRLRSGWHYIPKTSTEEKITAWFLLIVLLLLAGTVMFGVGWILFRPLEG